MARCKISPKVGEKFIQSYHLSLLGSETAEKIAKPYSWNEVIRVTPTRVVFANKAEAHFTPEQLKRIGSKGTEDCLASEAFTKAEAQTWLEEDIARSLQRLEHAKACLEALKIVEV